MPKSNAAEQRDTRQMPMQHLQAEIRALPRAEEGAETPDNEFEVVISTGATVRRFDWWTGERYDEELIVTPAAVRMERLNAGASVLNSHHASDLGDVIGAVVRGSAKVQNGQLLARVRIDDGPETSAVLRKIKSGIIRHVSMRYTYHRVTKIERANQPVLWRVQEWEPSEVSFVPIPADAGAGLRAQPALHPCEFITTNRKEEAMPKDNDTEMKETEQAKAAKTKATRAADPDPTEAPTEPPAEAEAVIRAAAVKEERARVAEITKRVQAAGLGDDFARTLINEGKSAAQASDAIFAELAKRQEGEQGKITSHVSMGDTERDKFIRGASDWIITKAGVAPHVAKHRNEKVEPGEFRGLSLMDLARESLQRSGVNTRGMDKMTLVGTAFTYRSSITQSTSDFAVLLENTMHKVLLAHYAMTADTWTRFCRTGSVSDFRAHHRYRQGMFGRLDAVGESGEFKDKAIPDGSKESITASTKGNIINLSRQTIINDDMGAFNDAAARLGRSAKLTIEEDVYALLAENSGLGPLMSDGEPLFDETHANIGTASTLGVEGLDGDRVTMGSQTDPSGNEILDLRPAILVVPLGLGGTARVINDAQYDPDTSNKLQKPNKVRGLFRDIVDTARLSAGSTRRYLFADPAIAPTIEVAFLDGQMEPFLESKEGWRVDGTQWKVRLDYGVGAIDWRGAVTNAGTGG